jgi:hypothetical protein
MIPNIPITLAFDTTSGGFAFAVFQGRETLLDWACSEVSKKDPQAWRGRVNKLLTRYQPDLVVLADAQEPRRGQWAKRFTLDIASLSNENGIAVRHVSRHEVKERFAASGTTKYEIAVAVTRVFPELASRLPRQRKPWMSEDKRMSIFDAVSFALVAISK